MLLKKINHVPTKRKGLIFDGIEIYTNKNQNSVIPQ